MPSTISRVLGRALSDAQLTSDEVNTLKQAVATGQVSGADLSQLAQRYGDLFQTGAGASLASIAPASAHVVIPPPLRSLGDDHAASAVLSGDLTLQQGKPAPKPAVIAFQRALDSLANRMSKPAWALPSGADGGFGSESTAAVKAFQTDNGLPVTGAIDQMTAYKMEELLKDHAPPAIGGVMGPMLTVPDGDAIAKAAVDLVKTRGPDYGIAPAWKSPNPSVPGNKMPNQTPLGATNHWKCNLFGMDALYMGGAKPAQYPGGAYPIAIEIPNYAKGANAPLNKLGEVWPDKDPANAQAKIDAMLKIARPGDLLIVKHHGTDTADGGHTRVVVANNYAANGTVDCAQASYDSAVVKPQTISDFDSEDAVYLLRPAVSR
jgi:peptidoglycan hydrolase-like protein with peptidoglycan-binding domain